MPLLLEFIVFYLCVCECTSLDLLEIDTTVPDTMEPIIHSYHVCFLVQVVRRCKLILIAGNFISYSNGELVNCSTVVREFFVGKIFRRLNFCMTLFSSTI